MRILDVIFYCLIEDRGPWGSRDAQSSPKTPQGISKDTRGGYVLGRSHVTSDIILLVTYKKCQLLVIFKGSIG